eukprot:scaffold220559_cov17-Prasinocladus_malaysianus.AAC.1
MGRPMRVCVWLVGNQPPITPALRYTSDMTYLEWAQARASMYIPGSHHVITAEAVYSVGLVGDSNNSDENSNIINATDNDDDDDTDNDDDETVIVML